MDLKYKILEYCKLQGLELVGFIRCRRFDELYNFYKERKEKGIENEFEEKDIEKRINPNHYMSTGKTIISIAFPYFHNVIYKDNGFSLYTRGKDYHYVVSTYLNKICEYIKTLGGEAKYFVDSNTLPERYIAYLSGIGFIGKNNMLITKDYGSYVFLGEIITDLDINVVTERNLNNINKFLECGKCNICYKECPTKAINKNIKNCNICMSYITQKKEIETDFLTLINGRIFGCDTCQSCCPYNRKIKFSNIEEFNPLEFTNETLTEKILSLNNKEFKETFKQTSCGWRGKNTLIRNAMIRRALFEKKDISLYSLSSEQLKSFQIRLLKIYEV
ncbi:tRNA epoxyqueuosine(34) reductase QueG [Clostridium tarantellae]|uniref:tRNA epoxyqueuosine(34) reductase QueG n=1 Tax=Clostridium tarantellae TaxID=39493 RepID=A0A6I1MLT1_9CLOT|nr:tRNA epoxyqueuosine(34) reductase QueG [Clostridium tarantellae]MPQ43192.1 tRNA epoxyqueuosine(34) reductase QueG [Clostridium tarantellae]